jgi:chemotaxis protein MotB
MTNGMTIRCRRFGLLIAAVCGASMVGCANTQIDNLETANRTLTERNQTLQRDLEEARAESELLRTQRREADQTIARQNETLSAMRGQLGDANDRFGDLNDRLNNIPFADLDAQTDAALRDLARRFPNMVSYDPERGMLRFSSDLTFDSGSDAVKADANASLQALADVLKTTATAYEIHVVGHTDAQPISAGTAQRHPSNMHLACHRAISVRKFLINTGVPSQNIMAAGWGELRPIVPNTGTGNTPQNRRVEIYLTRSSKAMASESITSVPSGPEIEPTK